MLISSVQIRHMIDNEEKGGLRLKTYFTGAMVFMASAVVSYNMLFSQDTMPNRPGSTAVRVEVKDMEEAPSLDSGAGSDRSSIGRLVDQTANNRAYAQTRALTSSIQGELGKLGYYKGAVDGQNGPQTQSAIIRYQRQVQLQANGRISQSLLDHIRLTRKISESAGITGSIQPKPRAQQRVQPQKTPQSQPVHASIQVQMVQQKLALFGYKPGKIDGMMGRATINAIKQFEKDRSMKITGKITTALKLELDL